MRSGSFESPDAGARGAGLTSPARAIVCSQPSIAPSRSVWAMLSQEARLAASREPILAGLLSGAVLKHRDFPSALSFALAEKLGAPEMPSVRLRALFDMAIRTRPDLPALAADDLRKIPEKDPACEGVLKPFLFFKGYLALQAYRVANAFFHFGRRRLAYALQGRASEVFHLDIHPAAELGRGIFIDHGTGITIDAAVVVGDDVTILQGVTLAGGRVARPESQRLRVGRGVLLSADATVRGCVVIGDDAKIAAGSLVTMDVPSRCTAVGVPARLVNCGAG